MKSLKSYIIQEAFIDDVFVAFKKDTKISNKFKKANTKIDQIAKSTVGTYKSVGKDGVKAWIGDIAYLLSNDDKIKMQWSRGCYKDILNLNDKTKTELIQNLYNDKGSNYKDIYDLIANINNKMLTQYKWKKTDQSIYLNDNEEDEGVINYDLYIDTLQKIAIQLNKQK